MANFSHWTAGGGKNPPPVRTPIGEIIVSAVGGAFLFAAFSLAPSPYRTILIVLMALVLAYGLYLTTEQVRKKYRPIVRAGLSVSAAVVLFIAWKAVTYPSPAPGSIAVILPTPMPSPTNPATDFSQIPHIAFLRGAEDLRKYILSLQERTTLPPRLQLDYVVNTEHDFWEVQPVDWVSALSELQRRGMIGNVTPIKVRWEARVFDDGLTYFDTDYLFTIVDVSKPIKQAASP